MLGLVDLGDQTGAIEYMAVMTAVAYRTVVDTVYPLGFLLLGESLGLTIVGCVIKRGGEKFRAGDIDQIGVELGIEHPHLYFLSGFVGVAEHPLLVIDRLFDGSIEQGGTVLTAEIASGELGSFRVDMGEGCHHIAAAV